MREIGIKEAKMAPIYILIGMLIEISLIFWLRYDGSQAAFVNGKSNDISQGWIVVESGEHLDIPHAFRSKDGPATLRKQIEEDAAGMVVEIAANNSYVTAKLDGEVIYDDLSETGAEAVETVRVATIPEEANGNVLELTFTPIKGTLTTYVRSITMMHKDISIIKRLKDGLSPMFCAMLMLIAAITLMLITAIRDLAGWGVLQPMWFGVFGLTAVIECLAESGIPTQFFGNKEIFLFAVNACIAVMPLLFICYMEPHGYSNEWSILYIAAVITGAAEPILRGSGMIPTMAGSICADILLLIASANAVLMYTREEYRVYGKAWILDAIAMLFIFLFSLNNGTMRIFATGLSASWVAPVLVTASLVLCTSYQAAGLVAEYRMMVEQAEIEAIQANEAKGKFLANMSHEIRTPINAVLGMDEMILRSTYEQETKGYAEDIYAAGNALLSVVNDILDLSKIEAGKMEIIPDEYDLCAMLHDTISMVEPKSNAKGLELKVEIDPSLPIKLFGDETRIRQTIINILNNAVKYTEKGRVTLTVKWAYDGDENGYMDVRVKDTGVGIKEEDMPKLFAEYERIEENRHKGTEGTGLGLSITIRMLKLMESKLQVKSKYGKGSVFYFVLPQGVVDRTPMGDFRSREKELKGRYTYETSFIAPDAKILVVDDNTLNLKVFTGLLQENEMQITEATSGKECLELVSKNRYDIIFLDHMMPMMDGIETFKRMRKMKNNQCLGTPVFALTANAIAGAKEEYLSIGFDGFVSKPIVSDQLQELIRTTLPEKLLKAAPDRKDAMKKKSAMKVAEETAKIPDIDGIDKGFALLHFTTVDMLMEALAEFYKCMDGLKDKLENAYAGLPEDEFVDLYRIEVHGMKGAALAIGAFQVGGIARTLEMYAKKSDIISIQTLHPLFMAEWKQLKKDLAKGLGIKKKKLKPAPPGLKTGLIMMAVAGVDTGDVDQADRALSQLKGYRMDKAEKLFLKRLSAAVMDIDPDSAEEVRQEWNDYLGGASNEGNGNTAYREA